MKLLVSRNSSFSFRESVSFSSSPSPCKMSSHSTSASWVIAIWSIADLKMRGLRVLSKVESLVCRRAPAAKLRKKDTVERKNDQGEISKIDEWVEVFNIPIDFAVSTLYFTSSNLEKNGSVSNKPTKTPNFWKMIFSAYSDHRETWKQTKNIKMNVIRSFDVVSLARQNCCQQFWQTQTKEKSSLMTVITWENPRACT